MNIEWKEEQALGLEGLLWNMTFWDGRSCLPEAGCLHLLGVRWRDGMFCLEIPIALAGI